MIQTMRSKWIGPSLLQSKNWQREVVALSATQECPHHYLEDRKRPKPHQKWYHLISLILDSPIPHINFELAIDHGSPPCVTPSPTQGISNNGNRVLVQGPYPITTP